MIELVLDHRPTVTRHVTRDVTAQSHLLPRKIKMYMSAKIQM